MAAALALFASLLWGSSDFGGGLLARRLPVMVVIAVSQLAALVILTVVVVVAEATGQGAWTSGAIGWGVVSGFAGMLGLICFYSALASGAMGVVAPIASLGLAVPVAVGLIRGDRPSGLQLTGIAVAVVGVVLVARAPTRADETAPARSVHHRTVALAVVASVGFGVALLAVAEGSGGENGRYGQVLAVLLSQRLVILVTGPIGLAVVHRQCRGSAAVARSLLPRLAAVGVVDLSANLAYGYASLSGLVSVVSVLASLYPVVTVLLARYLLRERLGRGQLAGVGISLAGVALLGLG